IRLREIVRDEDGGSAEIRQQRAELVSQRAPQRRVERRARLVEQKQRGIDGQRAPEGDALALASGQLARVPMLEAGEAEPLDDGRGPLGAARARKVAQAEADILGHREVRKERVALED